MSGRLVIVLRRYDDPRAEISAEVQAEPASGLCPVRPNGRGAIQLESIAVRARFKAGNFIPAAAPLCWCHGMQCRPLALSAPQTAFMEQEKRFG